MSKRELTRRTFLMGTAAAVAGCATGPYRNSKTRPVSPNEKLNVAAIGAGGKGRSDIHGCKSENIVALCDADWRRAAETFTDFPNAARYTDFREMLDKQKDIDAVTISTPDHFHAYAAYAAMQMGKHVYVQKPLTYTIGEARLLQKTARETGVATQMGNQGHSNEGVRKLCEMLWNGDIGDVKEVHMWTNRPIWPQGIDRPTDKMDIPEDLDWDLWLGPAPERPYHSAYAPFKWRGWWDFGCGALGDMACHIADAANWALHLSDVGPTSVEALVNENVTSETYPTKSSIRFEFPARGSQPPVTVYWHDGGITPDLPEGIPAGTKMGEGDNGSLFIGTKGVATCNTYAGNPRLLPDAAMADYTFPEETITRVRGNDPYLDWIDACKGDVDKACSNFDYAAPFTEWILLGNLSLRYPGKLEWDAMKGMVTNMTAANEHINRQYRKGWELPV